MFNQLCYMTILLLPLSANASADERIMDRVAQPGKLLCFAPDDSDKTCWGKHTLTRQVDGSYFLFGERLLDGPYNVRRTADIQVNVESNRYCYPLDAKLVVSYRYYLDGLEMKNDEDQSYRDRDFENVDRRRGSTHCCELWGQGVNLVATVTFDGEPVIFDGNLMKTLPARLIDEGEGYKLRLYR